MIVEERGWGHFPPRTRPVELDASRDPRPARGGLGHANFTTILLYDKRQSRPEEPTTFKVEYRRVAGDPKEVRKRLIRALEDNAFGECILPDAERRRQEEQWSGLLMARLDGERFRSANDTLNKSFPETASKLNNLDLMGVPEEIVSQAQCHVICAEALLTVGNPFVCDSYLKKVFSLVKLTPKELEEKVIRVYRDIDLTVVRRAIALRIIREDQIPLVLTSTFDYSKTLLLLSRLGEL